ncbi:MAG: acyl-CoA dehydrogenase [Nitriliruptorales bacterium]|nr:acyl-CoA dehydrogenase [Nitriliruptorales bacterium]
MNSAMRSSSATLRSYLFASWAHEGEPSRCVRVDPGICEPARLRHLARGARMPFFQSPPVLPDTWVSDVPLQEHLERLLPVDMLAGVRPQLAELGRLAATTLHDLAAEAERDQPRHIPFDAWGRRSDQIAVSPAWEELHTWQVRLGLCAVPYDTEATGYKEHARVVQMALHHLYGPSSATYTCPVAMTDAAARVLLDHADVPLRDRVVARLTSRDPDAAWTSGQWMTEREGGSDVSRTATIARQGANGSWTLHGTKWFTSATTANCALALARPEGAESGSRGLALFLVERIDPRTGESQIGDTIRINRLKDKLGTKSMPTAELTLDGAFATPVGPVEHGVRKISGMLNITRFHNAMGASGGMRRGVELAVAYSRVREATGSRLIDLPLHTETLAAMSVDAEAAFALTVRVAHLIGRAEHGTATDAEQQSLRALIPVTKLLTGKDAVALASEALEAFGGAGYIEDTGLPLLLRNAQVLPIWEGTTNVLSLDLLRAATRNAVLPALFEDLAARLGDADVVALAESVRLVAAERDRLMSDAQGWHAADTAVVQAGMRQFAIRLGRAYTAALLCEHAAYRLAKHDDDRAALVARRYVRSRLAGAAEWSRPDPAESAAILMRGHAQPQGS